MVALGKSHSFRENRGSFLDPLVPHSALRCRISGPYNSIATPLRHIGAETWFHNRLQMEAAPSHCPLCFGTSWSLTNGVLVCDSCGTQSQVCNLITCCLYVQRCHRMQYSDQRDTPDGHDHRCFLRRLKNFKQASMTADTGSVLTEPQLLDLKWTSILETKVQQRRAYRK